MSIAKLMHIALVPPLDKAQRVHEASQIVQLDHVAHSVSTAALIAILGHLA